MTVLYAILGAVALSQPQMMTMNPPPAELGETIRAAYAAESAAIAQFDCADDDIACLSDEILERFRVDQWVRTPENAATLCGEFGQSHPMQCQMQSLGTAAFNGDVPNLARLKEIMAVHGWPSPPTFSNEVQRAAWYLAQHGQYIDEGGRTQWDTEFATSILPDVMDAVQADELNPWAYAAMFDRIRTTAGEPQRYGTQVFCTDGVADFTFEDPDAVDAFRAEIGMEPFDQAAYDAWCG
ncbi:hypothetical protein NHF40_12115 [Maricaulaceae bacterium EIL42A08]|nr:hypothetical protein [Maricaulaceae bacterium EIL42A08]